jgi:alpha-L-fucosidase
MNITPIMIKTKKLISFVCLLAPTLNIQATEETSQQRDQRMEWWREAKFGLFIHWGVYAVPAGTYKDDRVGGIGEWIMLNGAISITDYRDFAGQKSTSSTQSNTTPRHGPNWQPKPACAI